MNYKNFIVEENGFHKEQIEDNGNRFLLGNGYMGIRGTLDEFTKHELVALNLAGIYDRVGDGWREPLNAPNFLLSNLFVDGNKLSVLEGNPVSHNLKLDFYRGILNRTTVYEVNGKKITYTSERFPDMENPHFVYGKMTVTSDSDTEITFKTGVDLDVWDIFGPHFVRFTKEMKDRIFVRGYIQEDRDFVEVSELTVGFIGDNQVEGAVSEEDLHIFRTFNVQLKAGETVTFYKAGSVFTSKDDNKDLEAPELNEASYKEEKANHEKWWAEKWENSGVTIVGDDAAERAVNYSLYHLHSIAPRHAKNLSIAARGLSGQTYKGAVFWDTEMFILDFFLYTEPNVAKTLMKYRVDTLKGAKEKARGYGYKGAFYAWESQEGGYDACSDYNVTDVFTGRPMRTFFKDKQFHISAAVVFGMKKYFDVTGDYSLLYEGGLETIIECALFYQDLLLKKVNSDVYEIRDVIGPDEYHERVHNNGYTNRMAKMVFDEAVDKLEDLSSFPTEVKKSIKEKYDVKKLIKEFKDASEHLYIPKPNEEGIIPQFDGYFNLEDVTVDQVRSRLLHEKEYWGGAYGVASQTKVIKQADVVTELTLFSDEYSKDILDKNWKYYEPRTEHGSSLSACMYAWLACICGRPDDAYPFFMKSAEADIRGGGKQWAGLVYIGGSHPAAEGGAYLNALHGFAGISVKNGELVCEPHLPKTWKELSFNIIVRNVHYHVEIKDGKKAITALSK